MKGLLSIAAPDDGEQLGRGAVRLAAPSDEKIGDRTESEKSNV
jgi:hypothetical protein